MSKTKAQLQARVDKLEVEMRRMSRALNQAQLEKRYKANHQAPLCPCKSALGISLLNLQ